MGIGVRFQPLTRVCKRRVIVLKDTGKERFEKQMNNLYTDKIAAIQQRRSEILGRYMDSTRKDIFTRISEFYTDHSQKYAEKLSRSKALASVAALLRQEPRALAVGSAEGLLLFKLTYPMHAPMNFYLAFLLL